MDYYEIRKIVTETTAEHWVGVRGVEQVAPEISTWTEEGNLRMKIEAHSSLAVFARDVSLALAWGLPQNQGKAWEGIWAEWATFPDRTVYGYYVDVLWCGVPVLREAGASVDGARGIVPAPDAKMEGAEVRGWTVSRFHDGLFRLVDEIFSHGEYDRYFAQAGFEIRD